MTRALRCTPYVTMLSINRACLVVVRAHEHQTSFFFFLVGICLDATLRTVTIVGEKNTAEKNKRM